VGISHQVRDKTDSSKTNQETFTSHAIFLFDERKTDYTVGDQGHIYLGTRRTHSVVSLVSVVEIMMMVMMSL
jgi:hypothetical protein